MISSTNLSRIIPALIVSSMLGACASVKKVDYAANAVPSDEIARLDAEITKGYDAQFDILADEEFSKARGYLKEAKSDLARNKKQRTILKDLGYARAYLDKAEALSADRQSKVRGILDARKAAADAGARELPAQRVQISKLDKKARSLTTGKMSIRKFDEMQTKYFDLELSAIQATNLAKAQANIAAAKDHRAVSYTPKYLKAAEIDLMNARNLITVNRHNPDAFRDAVARATASSQFLLETLEVTRTKDQPTEDVAAEIVRQRDQIKNLRGEQEQLAQTLTEQERQLSDAQAAQNLEQALESARHEFKRNEAEVYRQGDKLLIRLKAMNFPHGSSDLPAQALPLLAKVKGIAQDLNPSQVVIEGHTDATGGPSVNQQISQDRARAVATYFEENGIESDKVQAVGQGYKRPIATNKTKQGRATNRRVDVIITPSGRSMQ